jgi:replicative DNA helicase
MKFEGSVIGSLLINKSAIETVRGIVQPSDFFNVDYSEALRAIYNLADSDSPVDVFTLHDELQKDKYSCKMGRMDLSDLLDSVPSAANVEYYAERVLDESKRRSVHRVAEAANNADSGSEAVDEALKQLTELSKGKQNTESHINQALSRCIEETESIFNGDVEYIKTGLTDLDEMINGFTGGRLYVLGARPAMGKTALALNFALDAIKKDVPVMFFSMEMTSEELVLRLICSAASMNTKAQNNMQDDDWAKMTAGFSILKDKKLIIDDGAGHDINYIKSSIRTHAAKNEKAFYILDYLQLMRVKGENRIQGIGEITRELKILAKEVGRPILLLSQLSRGLEQRPDKRPVMSDLRESGEIEQDADVIMFIYRDEVYFENSEFKGVAEVLVRKHRQGETGTVRILSELQYARFKNLGGASSSYN